MGVACVCPGFRGSEERMAAGVEYSGAASCCLLPSLVATDPVLLTCQPKLAVESPYNAPPTSAGAGLFLFPIAVAWIGYYGWEPEQLVFMAKPSSWIAIIKVPCRVGATPVTRLRVLVLT